MPKGYPRNPKRKLSPVLHRPKPQLGCKHDWQLPDVRPIPTCVHCKGEVHYGEIGYTMVLIEARMKCTRGSMKVAYDYTRIKPADSDESETV